ncbi:hypothetical protein Angca_005261, partial [Angiostrongylus cantonensis]
MDLNDVVRAVCAIYDPLTSNERRLECTQIVENFKEGPVDSVLNVAFEVISQNSLILRYTGWTLIEDLIRYKWNSIPTNLRLELRSRVFHAIDVLLSEEIVECCARCVVAMMEHEWPQNWPELNSELHEITSRESLYCALVFAIERRLIENVATLASVGSQRRRKEMHNAMFECANDFLVLALNKLESCQLDEVGTLAAKNIIGWLTELWSCSSSAIYEEQLTRIVDIVTRYLNTAQRNIYEHAARCLATLASRKREKHENTSLIPAFFREEVLSTILTTISLAAGGSPSNEQHYEYLKSLCELLTTLGNFLSRVWKEELPPDNFGMYMSAIVAFFNHDSLYLKHESCDVLLALSTNPLFRQNEDVVRSIRVVFSNTLNALTKKGYPSQDPSTPASRFSQMDFDDDLEWHNLFSRELCLLFHKEFKSVFFFDFRSRVHLLIVENIDVHFGHLLSIFESAVLKRVLLDPQQVIDAEWEAMIKFAKSVIAMACESKIADTEHDRLLTMRDTLVMSMTKMTDYDILSEMLSLHSPFICTYEGDWKNLSTFFSLLRK